MEEAQDFGYMLDFTEILPYSIKCYTKQEVRKRLDFNFCKYSQRIQYLFHRLCCK